VGDTPAITPGSLESASLTTWTTILDDVENVSRERGMFADALNLQIADQIRNLGIRSEELRKRVAPVLGVADCSTLISRQSCWKIGIKCIQIWQRRKRITMHSVKSSSRSAQSRNGRMMAREAKHNPPTINISAKQITLKYAWLPECCADVEHISR
jgi:hypothetical protein